MRKQSIYIYIILLPPRYCCRPRTDVCFAVPKQLATTKRHGCRPLTDGGFGDGSLMFVFGVGHRVHTPTPPAPPVTPRLGLCGVSHRSHRRTISAPSGDPLPRDLPTPPDPDPETQTQTQAQAQTQTQTLTQTQTQTPPTTDHHGRSAYI